MASENAITQACLFLRLACVGGLTVGLSSDWRVSIPEWQALSKRVLKSDATGTLADSQKATEPVEDRNSAHVDHVEGLPTVDRTTGAERDVDVKSTQATGTKPLPTSSVPAPANVTLTNADEVPAKYSDAWKHHADFKR